MSIFDDLFGGTNKKAYEKAAGEYGPYQDAIQKLLNPGALQNEWAQGYETSPYAQQLMQQAKTSGLDAASSQGLLGSSTALSNIQTGASNIMSADRQKYLDDLMAKYSLGTQQQGNLSDKLSGLTYGAETAKSDALGNILGMLAQAGLAYGTGGASLAIPAMTSAASDNNSGFTGPPGFNGGGFRMPDFASSYGRR